MTSTSWVLITGANRVTGLGYLTAKKLVNDSQSVIIGARSQAAGALAACAAVSSASDRRFRCHESGSAGSYVVSGRSQV